MIEKYSFGCITVKGTLYTRDIKIIGDVVVPDWWRKNGHWVEADDISDILSAKTDILILGKGTPGLMKPTKELKKYLLPKKIKLIEVPTPEAIDRYNRLVTETKYIAAGFHLTC